MGKAYWASAVVIGLGALAASAAMAEPDAPSRPALGVASPDAPVSKTAAVERCVSRVQDRMTARGAEGVTLAALNRTWPGAEGWIVDVSVDVASEGGKARRRAFTCRQSRHGLHVARS